MTNVTGIERLCAGVRHTQRLQLFSELGSVVIFMIGHCQSPTQYSPPAWLSVVCPPVFPGLNGLAHCGPSSNFHGDLIEAFGHVEVGPAAKPDMIFGKDKPRPESGLSV